MVPATTANLGAGCDCIGLALALYNKVEVTLGGEGLQISVRGEGDREVPRDASNLVWQAAKKVWQKIGFPVPTGARIFLENNIPVGAGLGSSAAAIIGGMLAANALSGGPLRPEEILELAAVMEGHPDNVAPALYGGAVVSVTEESRILALKLQPAAELQAVVAVPDLSLPTKEARRLLPSSYPREDALFNVGRAALLAGALATKRYEFLRAAMRDRLYHPYRAALVPGLEAAINAALRTGALGAVLSGAGPGVLALTLNDADNIGRAMQAAFADAGLKARLFILKPDEEGARVERMASAS